MDARTEDLLSLASNSQHQPASTTVDLAAEYEEENKDDVTIMDVDENAITH